jgi:DNA-binding NarL/FixJ family response regulator
MMPSYIRVGTLSGLGKERIRLSTHSGEEDMPRILYVEYHSAVRQAASWVFDQEPDLEVVSQAASVAEGRKKMAQGDGGIDAAIVSIPLPDEGAEEFVRELHDANPSIPVLVMLPDLEDPELRPRFLGTGAREVVAGSKEASLAEVLAVVRTLAHKASLAEVLAAVRRLGGEGSRDGGGS